MFRILFTTMVLAAICADCKTFTISGPTWKNEIKACWSGGDHRQTYTFYLGRLTDHNVTYEDIIGASISVMAEGDLQLETRKEGWIPKDHLSLSHYSEASKYKQFRGIWKVESYLGWATQIVQMVLTVRFNDDDSIHLDTEVYAGSWGAVSCCETRAYVERIKVAM